jgi:hypothetical protein
MGHPELLEISMPPLDLDEIEDDAPTTWMDCFDGSAVNPWNICFATLNFFSTESSM